MERGERKTGFFGRIGAVLSALRRFLNRRRLSVGFIALGILLIVFVILNIAIGTEPLSMDRVLDGLFNANSSVRNIVMNVRMVRIVPAILLGGALALSGFLLQTFFANPIAGPFILGISSGAKLMITITTALFFSRGGASSIVQILASFLGAMLSMGFVLAISYKVKRVSMLVICGIMIGYICSAVTEFLLQFIDDSNIIKLHHWTQGGFGNIWWDHVIVIAAVVIPALVLTFLLSKPMGAYQLGETYARNMGVNIRAFRIALILLSGVLSACVTAFAGPISFVGVAVPHLMRRLFKTEKPIVMIPACFLGGATFCLLCDLIARTLVKGELSISSVTAIFGAPVVIFVMIRRQKEGGR